METVRCIATFVFPNSQSEREHETVAFFRISEQQKRAGTRDCCTFSYFRTAKASGNTRLLHFFVLPNSKSEREHETVALSRTSEQQKRAGTRDCCTFSYFRPYFRTPRKASDGPLPSQGQKVAIPYVNCIYGGLFFET